MQSSSRDIYQQRLHKALRYIDEHLDEPLTLVAVAEAANFSSFHFHRLFSAWMGETFGDYLRRRRVEMAARCLSSQPRLTILEAALSVGFGSAEAFSRAFKLHFGSSPSRWRNSNPDQMKGNADQESLTNNEHDVLSGIALEHMKFMQVELIERKPVEVAYLRYYGAYGEPISHFWQQVYYPWAATNQVLDCARYGISHDDPSITAIDKCRYDACVEVPADKLLTGQAQRAVIAGGRYASAAFYGTAMQVANQWAWLLKIWLPESGLQLDNRPCFEYYPKGGRYDPQTGEFECQICIPVAPL